MKPETYKALLKDLQKLQKNLVASQIAAVRRDPALTARMARLHAEAEVGGRVDDFVATAARKSTVLFLLRTVFVRVLEDLGILGLKRIRGDWGFAAFREVAPSLDHRAYFAFVFRDLAIDFPALFAPGDDELPLPDEDGCVDVWELWHHPNREGEHYVWNGDGFDSRFLGDLYQDLDKDIRKRYALLQTPRFIEEYILDHTLTPALAEFDPAALREKGETFRVIDPTCGSGHFLIGAFHRLADYWRDRHGLGEWEACERALESVWGCDINPHAVDIAAFRLLLEVVARTGVKDLDRLAAMKINLRTLDSLIPWEGARQADLFAARERLIRYATPPQRASNSLFLGRSFHVGVGNPPYIQPSDPSKRDDYREFWPDSVRGKYSLSAPFVERFFSLVVSGGHVGMINSNAFAMRKFGKPLVEQVLSRFSVCLVVDSQGANIPHHEGVPTLILIAANRPPSPNDHTRFIIARRASKETSLAGDQDPIWRSMHAASSVPHADYQDENVEAQPLTSAELARHPWALAPRASTELLERIESGAARLDGLVEYIGFNAITSATELLHLSRAETRRFRIETGVLRDFVDGSALRDYVAIPTQQFPLPYSAELDLLPLEFFPNLRRYIWPHRWWLSRRFVSGGTRMEDVGLPYHAIPQFSKKKVGPGIALAYAEVSTTQHVAIVDSSNLYDRTAPILRLKGEVSRADYLDLLGLLTSSLAEFWIRHRCHNKRKLDQPYEDYFQRASERLGRFPITARHAPQRTALALKLEALAQERARCLPASLIGTSSWTARDLGEVLDAARARYGALTRRMVLLQEELDWLTYASYGLIDERDVTLTSDCERGLAPGHRPFEILLAQREAELEADERSTWWTRLGHERVVAVPAEYGTDLRARIEQRIAIIASNPDIALIEVPAFKRRWQSLDWEAAAKDAAEAWLLDRLESLFFDAGPDVGSLPAAKPYRLEEIVSVWTGDARVAAVAGIWTGSGASVDIAAIAETLLNANAIPDNPHRVYSASGLVKVQEWRRVWEVQDQHDAVATATVDAPSRSSRRSPPASDGGTLERKRLPLAPMFGKGDFVQASYFSIRGKLNVPRERFIIFSDLSLPRFGWNGWRDRERALAQADAFTLAENDPANPLPPPTVGDPRRCGVTIGLWESLPDVKRWGSAAEHAELLSLAQEACWQTRCPCPVLDAWKAKVQRGETAERDALVPAPSLTKRKKGKGNTKAADAENVPTGVAAERTISLPERAWVARLLETGKEVELAGIGEMHRRRVDEAMTAARGGPDAGQLRFAEVDGTLPAEVRAIDEVRLAIIVDDLVASGDLAVRGRGKKKRYQLVPRQTRA